MPGKPNRTGLGFMPSGGNGKSAGRLQGTTRRSPVSLPLPRRKRVAKHGLAVRAGFGMTNHCVHKWPSILRVVKGDESRPSRVARNPPARAGNRGRSDRGPGGAVRPAIRSPERRGRQAGDRGSRFSREARRSMSARCATLRFKGRFLSSNPVRVRGAWQPQELREAASRRAAVVGCRRATPWGYQAQPRRASPSLAGVSCEALLGRLCRFRPDESFCRPCRDHRSSSGK